MEKIKDFIISNKYWFIAQIVGLLMGIGVGFYFLGSSSQESDACDSTVMAFEEEDQDEIDCELFADISGAVVSPGVYCLSSTSIVDDLISLAGGFSDSVCQGWVSKDLNRAQVVEDGLKLYIPDEGDSECGVSEQVSNDNQSSKVSINNSTQDEIETLSGIGPSIAKAIIDSRPYKKLEDLMDVKGIGTSIFNKIKDEISL